jgi:hypothetical protein
MARNGRTERRRTSGGVSRRARLAWLADVVITGSGSYDLTGSALIGGGTQDGYINSSLGLAVGGPFGSVDLYALTVNPGAFGTGNGLNGEPDVGDLFGYRIASDSMTLRVVPEPGTLALLGFGLAGLMLSRRRRAV